MSILAPFGKVYGRIMDLRNLLYDRDVLKSYPLGARTISVGNLTTGGTGKTPLVALIAEILIENGERVCILTRGYGRENSRNRVLVSDGESVLADARIGGDEPVELAQRLNSKAVIVADADRVAAAIWAREKFGITVFILDDGFQHRRARRDLDVLCIDAANPCGNGRILPAGTLRESFKSLKRANEVVITRADQVKNLNELKGRLRKRNADVPIFSASTEINRLLPLDEFLATTQRSQGDAAGHFYAFSGIGNPENFVATLKKAGLEVVGSGSFPDHHRYDRSDIDQIEKAAKQANATALVTTAKDGVKLAGLEFTIPCHVAIAETVIDDLAAFRELVISS